MKDNESRRANGAFRSAGRDHWRSLSSLAEKTEAGVLPGSRRFSLSRRVPVPRQQRFEFVPPGPSGDNSFKHVGQPGLRFTGLAPDNPVYHTQSEFRPTI